MSKNRLSYLLQRYQEGLCSKEELHELNQWYKSINFPIDEELPLQADEETKTKLADALLANFKAHKSVAVKHLETSPRKSFPWTRWAAIFVGFISVSIGAWLTIRHYTSKQAISDTALIALAETDPVRYVNLPDGSTVLLQPGSILDYTDGFSDQKRFVRLSGEAFFDVTRDEERPFTIQSHNLKTTVLGTSFSIRAYPNAADMAVTVATGKVHVEDENGFIAILTENKQVIYRTADEQKEEHEAEVDEVHRWIKQGMQFEGLPFHRIAEKLSKRYNLSIRFRNPDLEQCLITASFDGTEPIIDILKVICGTHNATYTFDQDSREVWIDGNGCS